MSPTPTAQTQLCHWWRDVEILCSSDVIGLGVQKPITVQEQLAVDVHV
ncbi:MAG: hypothetical protein V4587_18670 [Acidobacteriota bacterium]